MGKWLPRFKKRGVGDSFRLPQGVRIENRRVYLPKIGWVGFFKSREVIGEIRQATVTRRADGWYVSIQTEYEIPDPRQATGGMIGVDRGVAVFAAASDGELVEPLNAFTRSLERLARLQRQLARKTKGSRNRRKARTRVARMHQHVRRQREDFLHKLSTRWSKNHALIALEDLRIGSMTRSAKGNGRGPRKSCRTEGRSQPGDPRPGLGQVRGDGRLQADRAWGPARPRLAAAFEPGMLGVRSRRAGE